MVTDKSEESEEPRSEETPDPSATPAGDTGVVESQGSEAAQETPEGGSEAAEAAGGQPAPVVPHAPTGEELIEMLAGDAPAQRIIQGRLEEARTQALTDAQSKAKQEQLAQLLKDERYDEIGRMFVQEQQAEVVRTAAQEAALKEVYGGIYQKLFANPVMKNLTVEERTTLDPRNFADDAAYVLALTAFITTKTEGSNLQERVNTEVETKLETLRNMAAAGTAGNPSISGLPAAVGTGGEAKTSSELIAAGWAEQMAEANET
jgi:phosphoribosylformylglycinamidine (FGAM) synthase PurS component